VLWTGPRFFTTMQIPMTRGREIGDGDRAGTPPVAVVSERFAKLNFGDADPTVRAIGTRFLIGAADASGVVKESDQQTTGWRGPSWCGEVREPTRRLLRVGYVHPPLTMKHVTRRVETSELLSASSVRRPSAV